MPKNIVLCSDGTGNRDIKARGTNVFKLYEAVDIQGHKDDRTKTPQVAFYDDGIGTSSFLPLRIIGGAFGWGFSENVRDLYTELVHVYQPGDNLYLFGFSRGAYTIRALAGMIQYCGIVDIATVPNGELEGRVQACWKQFAAVVFKPFQRDAVRRRNMPAAVDAAAATERRRSLGAIMHPEQLPTGEPFIEFVGVWDTVAAVGAPFEELRDILNYFIPVKFAELVPGSRIKRACHALSLDDERKTFHPELWNEQGARPGQIEQVWFAGAHSNVGGGYSKQGMSLVTLDWMMAEAERCGLRFISGDREFVNTHQDIHGTLYDSRAGLAVYYRWGPRDIVALCRDHSIKAPKIHVSVLERIANGTGWYAPGNFPFACEVVSTPCPLSSATLSWPTPATLQSLKQVIMKPSHPSGGSLLDTVTRAVLSGKAAYYTFLVSTLVLLWWFCDPPSFLDHLAGQLGPRVLAAGLFVVVGVIVLAWSYKVDRALDEWYSHFWDVRREQLRKLLR